MKFLLTIYICSQITGICAIPPGYPKSTADYYTCTKEGISEAYELLYNGDTFNRDTITLNRLYPTYTCKKILLPKKKPDPKPPKIERSL
tara:strand:- start:522 stop:788 length:267 start_codon:yes stop_codon:yes gene_type:complete